MSLVLACDRCGRVVTLSDFPNVRYVVYTEHGETGEMHLCSTCASALELVPIAQPLSDGIG